MLSRVKSVDMNDPFAQLDFRGIEEDTHFAADLALVETCVALLGREGLGALSRLGERHIAANVLACLGEAIEDVTPSG